MNGKLKELLNVIIDNKTNFIIYENNDIYQLSSLTSQKELNLINISNIDFGDFEEKIKKENNIEN